MSDFLIHKTDAGWTNLKEYRAYMNALPVGKYLIEINSAKKRTNPQNSYYWAVVVPLVYNALRDAGFEAVKTKEDAHVIMRTLFLKVSEQHKDIKIEKVQSTTELTTVAFMEYLQSITIWAADYLNIEIPEPGEQIKMYEDQD